MQNSYTIQVQIKVASYELKMNQS